MAKKPMKPSPKPTNSFLTDGAGERKDKSFAESNGRNSFAEKKGRNSLVDGKCTDCWNKG